MVTFGLLDFYSWRGHAIFGFLWRLLSSATINSSWQTTEPDNDFLRLESEYRITYVTHYRSSCSQTCFHSSFTGLVCATDWQPAFFNLINLWSRRQKSIKCPPWSLQFPLILCLEISIKVSGLLMFSFLQLTCGLDLSVQDVESWIRDIAFLALIGSERLIIRKKRLVKICGHHRCLGSI